MHRVTQKEIEELVTVQRDLPKLIRLIRERDRILGIVEGRQSEIEALLLKLGNKTRN